MAEGGEITGNQGDKHERTVIELQTFIQQIIASQNEENRKRDEKQAIDNKLLKESIEEDNRKRDEKQAIDNKLLKESIEEDNRKRDEKLNILFGKLDEESKKRDEKLDAWLNKRNEENLLRKDRFKEQISEELKPKKEFNSNDNVMSESENITVEILDGDTNYAVLSSIVLKESTSKETMYCMLTSVDKIGYVEELKEKTSSRGEDNKEIIAVIAKTQVDKVWERAKIELNLALRTTEERTIQYNSGNLDEDCLKEFEVYTVIKNYIPFMRNPKPYVKLKYVPEDYMEDVVQNDISLIHYGRCSCNNVPSTSNAIYYCECSNELVKHRWKEKRVQYESGKVSVYTKKRPPEIFTFMTDCETINLL